MIRIPQLPNWCLTNALPAFHDYESLSAIDQTARLYGTMRGLIDDYNNFANQVNAKILEFVNDLNADQEQFKSEINQLVHDYIIALDMKVAHQDRQIEETITYFKDNLSQAVTDLVNGMKNSGEFDNAIADAFNGLGGRVSTLENKIDNLESQKLKVTYNSSNESLNFEGMEVENL